MQQGQVLDEAQIIQKIRQFGQYVLGNMREQQQQSITYTFSDSQNVQDRIIPTVLKPLRATKNLKKSRSPSGQKNERQKFSSVTSHSPYKMISANIKKRIFSYYQQQRLIEQQKDKTRIKKNPPRQYNSIKPRYLVKQPIIKNLSGYIQKNIYGRMKTEVEHQKPPRSLSKQQNEKKWQQFLRKSQEWEHQRYNSRIKAKINQNMKISQEVNTRPPRKSPPKMTVDDCLQKLRRQAQKLKQKLDLYNFQPRLYQNERRKRKQSKSRQKTTQASIKNPQQLKEKKFTIVKNPKKQLQFMFN